MGWVKFDLENMKLIENKQKTVHCTFTVCMHVKAQIVMHKRPDWGFKTNLACFVGMFCDQWYWSFCSISKKKFVVLRCNIFKILLTSKFQGICMF